MSGQLAPDLEQKESAPHSPDRYAHWASLALAVVGFGVVTLVTVLIAEPRMFTGFAPHDDEGYMLVSLQSFVQNGDLYDSVFSQYGPFYYELWGSLFALTGADVTHDAGRTITLIVWVASSLILGAATAKVTKSVLIGLGTQMATFYAIGTLTGEPMHPGGLICLLLASLIAVASLVRESYSPRPLAVLGAIAAALLLVKVNVGAFVVAAAFLVGASCYPALSKRAIRLSVECGFVALPVILLSAKFGEAWAREYAWHVAIASLALVIALRAHRGKQRSNGEITAFLAGGAALASVSLLMALGLGTSISGLFDGVIGQPLRQADAFTIRLELDRSFWLPGVLGLAGAVFYALFAARIATSQAAQALVAALSLTAGVALVLAGIGRTLGFDQSMTLGFRFEFLAFAWVAVIPSPLSKRADVSFARLFLPAVAVMQALHAYPVAGSQIGWATFLLIPTGAVCIANALVGFAALQVGRQLRWAGGAALAVAGLAFAMFIVDVTLRKPLAEARASHRASEELALPGATRMRLGNPEAEVYRAVADGVRENCGALLTLPGMNSFYVWSEQSPVTGLNTTAWPTLFDARKQRTVVEAARQTERLCVLRHKGLVEAWTGGPPAEGPLAQYLSRGLTPIMSMGGYELFHRATPEAS